MKRKQIYIDPEQERELKQLARARRVSEAVLIREALNDFLAVHVFKGVDRIEDHPLWGIIGLVDDPAVPADSSINHDHYIYGTPKKYRVREDGSVARTMRARG